QAERGALRGRRRPGRGRRKRTVHAGVRGVLLAPLRARRRGQRSQRAQPSPRAQPAPSLHRRGGERSSIAGVSDRALLAGVTVLDFTRVLAGPYCTRLMADLGARVIKIERPGEGDEMRRGYLQLDPAREDQSTYFIRINAGKLGVGIDLSRPE